MKRVLVAAAAGLALALGLVAWYEARGPQPVELIPSLTGQPEYCLTCHADLPEISKSHPVQVFGCVSCHGGERLALDATLAHSTMRGGANPSDPSVVEASCGGAACHSGPAADQRDHIQRVQTSLQTTYAGAIAAVRYAAGAQPDLTARLAIAAVEDANVTTPTGLRALAAFDPARETSPLVRAFAQNCLNCHLAAAPLPGPAYARMTGCAACHTPTAGRDLGPGAPPVHTLTTAIPYSQCNTCHNRGNYNLRDMLFHPRTDQPLDRLHDYYQPIGQFTRCEYELDCIDCHTRGEVMGDGDLHSTKKDVQYVQCRTCHGTLTELPATRAITDTADIALRQSFLNPVVNLQLGDRVVVTAKGEPLWNVRALPDGTFVMTGKANGQQYRVPLVKGSACQQKPDEQESRYCHACHAVQR